MPAVLRVATVAAAVLVAATPAGGTAAEHFDRHGISFSYPTGWSITTRPLSDGVNPIYRFAVGTAPVRRTSRDSGPCLPGVARQLARGDVLAYLREAIGADRARSLPRMPRRPRSFRLPTAADSSLCGFGPGGRWIPFKDAGRAFYLGVYVGPEAPEKRARALGRLLDRLQIDPL